MSYIPIITIDGPSGSGKGTIAAQLSHHLNYHLLDSGAIYRVAGLAAHREHLLNADAVNIADIITLCKTLSIQFVASNNTDDNDSSLQILLNDEPVSHLIRNEEVGKYASIISSIAEVRDALMAVQKNFAQLPGLVADGRDMGTVVFNDAMAKIYLTASAEARAERRVKQLQKAGIDANLDAILSSILMRDQRDMERAVAPLKPATDALIIDASDKSIEQVLQIAISHVQNCSQKLV